MITEQRKAQLDQFIAQRQGGQTGLTPERKAQLDAFIAQHKAQQPPVAKGPGIGQQIVQGIAQPFLEMGASAAGMVEGVGNLGGAALSSIAGDKAGAARQVDQANQALTRERDFGFLGKAYPVGGRPLTGNVEADIGEGVKDILGTGAQIGAYAAPVGTSGKAAFQAWRSGQGLGTLGKAVGQGALYSGLGSGLMSGGHALKTAPDLVTGLKETAVGTAIGTGLGAALPLASFGARAGVYGAGKAATAGVEGVKSVARGFYNKANPALTASDDLAAGQMNSVLRTPKKMFKGSRNPGSALADELAESGKSMNPFSKDHLPNSRADVVDFLDDAVGRQGKYATQVGELVNDPAVASKRIDMWKIAETLDEDIRQAGASGEPGLVSRLKGIKDGLLYISDETGRTPIASRPRYLSPAEATKIKTDIGSKINWFTNQPFDKNAGNARRTLYTSLKEAIENNADEGFRESGQLAKVGQVKALNDRWGQLLDAKIAGKDAMNLGSRLNNVSLGDMASGGAGAVLVGGPGAATAVAARRILEGTMFKTRLAVILRQNNLTLERLLAPGGEALIKQIPAAVDRMFLRQLLKSAAVAASGQTADQLTK